MLDGIIILGNSITRRVFVFNYLSLLASLISLAEICRKLKERSLCALCDSSEAGGKSILKQ
jgi:hypothetical protein